MSSTSLSSTCWMPSSLLRTSVPPNQVLAVISSRNELLASASKPELPLVRRVPQRLPGGRRLGVDLGVGDQRDEPGHGPDRAHLAVGIAVDEVLEQVLGVGQLRLVERRPQLRVLALEAGDLRHHRDVGRGDAGARRRLQLDEPRLARGLGHGLDLDAGLLGEVRVDVLVERVLEVATVGADLERSLGAGAADRRKAGHRKHAPGRERRGARRKRRRPVSGPTLSAVFGSTIIADLPRGRPAAPLSARRLTCGLDTRPPVREK